MPKSRIGNQSQQYDMGEAMTTGLKRICLAILIITAGAALVAQSSVVDLSRLDLESVDFSEARLSIAGPGAFLIRSVYLDGVSYSVIFRDDGGTWVVSELIPEDNQPLLPADVVLDFATISITETGLRIDGIIIDGQSYSTTLNITEDAVVVPGALSAAKFTGASLSRVRENAGLFSDEDIGTLTASQASLMERNTALISQVGDLTEQLTALQGENTRLTAAVQQLRTEKDTLDREVLALEDQLSALERAAEAEAVPEEELMGEATRLEEPADHESLAAEDESDDGETELLRQRIAVLLDKIAILEDQIVELELDLEEARSAAAVTSGSTSPTAVVPAANAFASEGADASAAEYLRRIAELEATVTELRIENARLSAERGQLEQDIRRSFLAEGYIAALKPELTEQRQRGFSMGDTQIGSWQLSGGVMTQTDPDEFFAKLELPMAQDARPTLYRFDARSRGAGWVGFGIHIFADGVEKRGYGYGESLLIWFTRDVREYGTNRTYLEVYRSSDDINMARVMSAAITDDISEWMDVELLYQPEEEYLTVAVNGEEKIRYKTWFGLEWGVDMALRTLDTAEFRDLEVLTTPGPIDWPE
jgi:regulator of replication initiation timing